LDAEFDAQSSHAAASTRNLARDYLVVVDNASARVIRERISSGEESLLLEDGSAQADVWGINIYPEENRDDRIEFDSMINVRPSQGNRSRGVDDPAIREQIRRVVERLVER